MVVFHAHSSCHVAAPIIISNCMLFGFSMAPIAGYAHCMAQHGALCILCRVAFGFALPLPLLKVS